MLGIDVSQHTLACALLLPTDPAEPRSFTVPNNAQGWQQLLDAVPANVPWVLEPTGRYSLWVAQAGIAAGRQVLLAPSRAARHFLASRQTRAKTDPLDGAGLAAFALSRPLRPYPVKPPDVEHLTQLLAVRRQLAGSLSRFTQQQRELGRVQEPLAQIIAALQAQLQQVEAEIAQLAADEQAYPRVSLLDQVPGVGPVVAATIGACLQEKRFRHPDAFVAYAGLDLKVQDSGQSRGRRRLTKEGPGELRRLLYLAAQANLRCTSSPFKDQYTRERGKGLSKTAALCAVARKLARVCWSIDKYGNAYEAERVNQPPPRRRAEPQEKN